MISVTSYGAVGDGVTDDTAAFLVALAALPARGGKIEIPAGDYRITAPISYARPGVWWEGEGSYSTRIINESTGDLFHLGDGSTYTEGGKFSDFGITSATARTTGSAIKTDYAFDTTIENVRISAQFIGLDLCGAQICHVDKCWVSGITPSIGVGVRIANSSGVSNDTYLREVFLSGDQANQPQAGILVEDTKGLWLDTISALFCGVGLWIRPASGHLVENIFSSRCGYDGHGIGWFLDACAGSTIRNIKSVCDWTCANVAQGILAAGAGTISNVRFLLADAQDNGSHGIHIANGKDVQVLHSSASHNSRLNTNPAFMGIVIGDVDGFDLLGNRAGALTGMPNRQMYGEYVLPQARNGRIIGNDGRVNLVGGLADASAAPKYVAGNL